MQAEPGKKRSGAGQRPADENHGEMASLSPDHRGWFAAIGLALVVVLAGACWWSIERARETALDNTQSRLNLIAEGRVELIRAWREGVVREAGRFANSQFLRAYAADRFGPGDEDPALESQSGVAARGDYLRNLARDFVERTRFRRALFVEPNGQPVFSSSASLGEVPPALLREAIGSAGIRFGQSFMSEGTPVVPFAYPVVRPQSDRAPGSVVGIVVFEIGLRNALRDASRLPDLAEGSETVRIIERAESGRSVLRPDGLAPWPVSIGDDSARTPFSRVIIEGTPSFLTGQPVAGLPWTVTVSTSVYDALSAWRRFSWIAGAVALGVALAVFGGLASLWFRLSAFHARRFAQQEHRFAQRIDRQRRLLDRITAAVPELIGLKDADGRYLYVNPSLAAHTELPTDRLIGADDAAVFGPTLAKRLEGLGKDAQARAGEATILDQVYRHGDVRHIRFTAQPFDDPDRPAGGVLLVGDDLTDIIRAEQARRAELERSIQALARAVETVDPYLAGHSRRLERLGSAIARDRRMSESDVTTVALAARLSQVGKLAIRRELLTSTDRHGPAEIREMQTHVDHANRILSEIHFELPVRETVLEMHERLDGSGYPVGLSGDAIRPTARVLGAVDVFCARIEPRSYRPPIDLREALDVLRSHPDRYDADVVAALERVVASPEGDKALADLGV